MGIYISLLSAQCEDHAAEVWPQDRFEEDGAVLCGACGEDMTVKAYSACEDRCPSCGASFNPGCRLHKDLYFASESAGNKWCYCGYLAT